MLEYISEREREREREKERDEVREAMIIYKNYRDSQEQVIKYLKERIRWILVERDKYLREGVKVCQGRFVCMREQQGDK